MRLLLPVNGVIRTDPGKTLGAGPAASMKPPAPSPSGNAPRGRPDRGTWLSTVRSGPATDWTKLAKWVELTLMEEDWIARVGKAPGALLASDPNPKDIPSMMTRHFRGISNAFER